MIKIMQVTFLTLTLILISGCAIEGKPIEEETFENKMAVINNEYFAFVIENPENYVADLTVSVDFLDSEKNMIETKTVLINAVGANKKLAKTIEDIPTSYAFYELKIEAVKSEYESYVDNIVSEKILKESGKINTTFVNNSSTQIPIVNMSVVYYKNNEIVAVTESISEKIKENRSFKNNFSIPLINGEEIVFDDYEVLLYAAYSNVS